MRAKVLKTAAIHLALIASSLIVLMPVLWAISSSFKPLADIFQFPLRWIPERFTFDNYSKGWRAANFALYFRNSVFVSVLCTITELFLASLTGFSLSRYRFPGRALVFGMVIATMIIPLQVRVIPLYLIIKYFGWINTFWALIVPGLVTSIGIFIMTQFIRFIPGELFDAARVDGCSDFGIYARVVLPLSRPGLAALAIVSFMTFWNDYFWPLVVINQDSKRTLPLGLAEFQGYYYTEYGQFFAVSLIVILPMVISFLVFQKQFIESAALSGLKG